MPFDQVTTPRGTTVQEESDEAKNIGLILITRAFFAVLLLLLLLVLMMALIGAREIDSVLNWLCTLVFLNLIAITLWVVRLLDSARFPTRWYDWLLWLPTGYLSLFMLVLTMSFFLDYPTVIHNPKLLVGLIPAAILIAAALQVVNTRVRMLCLCLPDLVSVVLIFIILGQAAYLGDLDGMTLMFVSTFLLLVLTGCLSYLTGWIVLTRRLKAKPQACLTCGYDLTGTVTAGKRACPECGRAILADQVRWFEDQGFDVQRPK
jgi:hypothetical protein